MTAAPTSSISRTYNGDTSLALTLPGITFTGTGGINGDTITGGSASNGTFDTPDAGTRSLALSGITLTAQDSGGKPVYGYQPSGTVSVAATIVPRPLTATLFGSTSRTYNGTTAATLASNNYQLSGLVGGQNFSINQTVGTYASANVGTGIRVTASLDPANFVAGANTLAANYVLPTSASGNIGTITRKQLTATLTGVASRSYDGTAAAAPLTASNFQLSGLVSGETLIVNQTSGTYASANAGSGITVTASLSAGNFTAGANTSASNYTLPTIATGAIGEITPRTLSATLTGISRTYDGTTAVTLSAGD